MNRQHLLYVYTGLRAEIERLATQGRPAAAAGASAAMDLYVQPRLNRDLSGRTWDPDVEPTQTDIH
jgi:hypothetical protein